MAMSAGAQALADEINALPAEIDAYTQAAVAKGRADLQAEHDEDIAGLSSAFDAVKNKITPQGTSASDAGAAAAIAITGGPATGDQGGQGGSPQPDADATAYSVAASNGFTGTQDDWIAQGRPAGAVAGFGA